MDKSVYVLAVGITYFDAGLDGTQPDFKSELELVCDQRYRRIDRFTQLALLGAGRCASSLDLARDTALYLASGKGPAANNIGMQEQIFRDREVPKPIQFINSVTNSASFYVMKDHSLTDQNLFISREQHAFEAAIELALLELSTGRFEQALVGFTDELTHPLEHQYRRASIHKDLRLGEGSHWILLSNKNHVAELAKFEFCRIFLDDDDLFEWLEKPGLGDGVIENIFFNPANDAFFNQQCLHRLSEKPIVLQSIEGHWDGLNAGVLTRFITEDNNQSGHLLIISKDADGRSQVMLVKK